VSVAINGGLHPSFRAWVLIVAPPLEKCLLRGQIQMKNYFNYTCIRQHAS